MVFVMMIYQNVKDLYKMFLVWELKYSPDKTYWAFKYENQHVMIVDKAWGYFQYLDKNGTL